MSSERTLSFASDHWPPWFIVDEASEPPNIGGIDIEILREVANRLNLKLKIGSCPWKRCLRMMETGELDIIASLGKSDKREAYIHYLNPPYRNKSVKVFYMLKGKGHQIRKYEDLYSHSVGVVRGYLYFPRFDNDKNIRKIPVTNSKQLLEMLHRGRIDVIVGNRVAMNYSIRKHGFSDAFEATPYRYDLPYEGYIGISKNSSLSKDIHRIEAIIKDMVDSGRVTKIIEKFTTND